MPALEQKCGQKRPRGFRWEQTCGYLYHTLTKNMIILDFSIAVEKHHDQNNWVGKDLFGLHSLHY